MHYPVRAFRLTLLASVAAIACAGPARALVAGGPGASPIPTPSGQIVTPTFTPGATFQALDPQIPGYPNLRPDGAIASAISPDGKTLVVMTSGYNTWDNAAGGGPGDPINNGVEYINVFDVSNSAAPVQKQVLTPQNTFAGLVWAPDGTKLYVSGGNDDQVIVYPFAGGLGGAPSTIQLNHGGVAIGDNPYGPQAAGLAVSKDGSLLVVANALNDSISVIDTASSTVKFEYDLRPFNTSGTPGAPGGDYPYGVAIRGNGIVYAASLRNREIVVVDITGVSPKLVKRIPLPGNPNAVLLNRAQTTLYVAQDNTDQVAVIDTATNTVTEEIDAIAPPGLLADHANRYTGAATNNVTLSPDEATLFVSNGGANAIAIVPLGGAAPHTVAALVPTGWYPTTVTISADGSTMYAFNSKSDPGPNPLKNTSSAGRLTQTKYPGNPSSGALAYGGDQYVFQLEQSGFLTVPVPKPESYAGLTAQVAANNGWAVLNDPRDTPTMSFLHGRITNVIYIVKENRTFDQVLGDLGNGSNGDPALTIFGRRVTPNLHNIAKQYVTLDNTLASGEVSGNGWPWSTAGRETDWNEKTIPMDYTFGVTRGNAPYDAEGQNANASVGYPTVAAREAEDPGYTQRTAGLPGGTINVLPGQADTGAPDGPNGAAQTGYIWDAAVRAGLTIRDYGFMSDNNRYGGSPTDPNYVPPLEHPDQTNTQVQFPTKPTLFAPGNFDPYFRGFDNSFPDTYRFEEFKREFARFDATKTLPNLILLRYMHDHMGNFGNALAGVTTPELQQADNDFAVGATMELLSHSANYANNTLVLIDEDDAQDGGDHMDAHRMTAFVIGPYVKRHAVVSTRYSSVNILRTIEDVLGTEHLNLFTAYQRPMTDVFDITQDGTWSYTATASTLLKATTLPLSTLAYNLDGSVRYADGPDLRPTHDAAYWDKATRGFDFSSEDRVPADLFNEVLWDGLMTGPYPTVRDGVRHVAADVKD